MATRLTRSLNSSRASQSGQEHTPLVFLVFFSVHFLYLSFINTVNCHSVGRLLFTTKKQQIDS